MQNVIEIKSFALTNGLSTEPNTLKVEIGFVKKSHTNPGSGYMLNLRLVHQCKSRETSRMNPAFRGASRWIEFAPRFSRKKLEKMAADKSIIKDAKDDIKELLDFHNYGLVDEQAFADFT